PAGVRSLRGVGTKARNSCLRRVAAGRAQRARRWISDPRCLAPGRAPRATSLRRSARYLERGAERRDRARHIRRRGRRSVRLRASGGALGGRKSGRAAIAARAWRAVAGGRVLVLSAWVQAVVSLD